MNETEKKIILALAKNGALNIYQLEKQVNLKHATAFKNVKELERNGLIKVISEATFRTGLKTKQYWLTWAGMMQAYVLGMDVETLERFFYKITKDKFDKLAETQKEEVEGFFSFLKETSREDISILFDCLDFSVYPPKPKSIPISVIQNPRSFYRMFATMLKHSSFKREIRKEVEELLEALK